MLFARNLQLQAEADASRSGSTHGDGTDGSQEAGASLHGAKSADGLNQHARAAATSGGSSGSRVNTSLVVSKSGALVPALILALVLGFCLLTAAIEVRRRTRRRAAGVQGRDDNGCFVVDGD